MLSDVRNRLSYPLTRNCYKGRVLSLRGRVPPFCIGSGASTRPPRFGVALNDLTDRGQPPGHLKLVKVRYGCVRRKITNFGLADSDGRPPALNQLQELEPLLKGPTQSFLFAEEEVVETPEP